MVNVVKAVLTVTGGKNRYRRSTMANMVLVVNSGRVGIY